MSKAAIKKDSFKTIVESTPDISKGYHAGLRAFGKYSKLIVLADNTLCSGSVDIDACTARKYPGANRWDYVFCHNDIAYFVEVHSAETNEVSVVLKKLRWLKDWLVSEAPLVNNIKSKNTPPYYWIQSGRYNIAKNSPQYRQAVQAGIKPISKLALG